MEDGGRWGKRGCVSRARIQWEPPADLNRRMIGSAFHFRKSALASIHRECRQERRQGGEREAGSREGKMEARTGLVGGEVLRSGWVPQWHISLS